MPHMPPLQLTNLLHTTLPHLSVDGRALLSALGCVNGRPTSISDLAQWLGFHDRYQLARALRREGLPPMETLGGWTRTLYWIIESQTSGLTLRELAQREHLDPAVAYRLVRRITGHRWSEIRQAGLTGALLSFRGQCRSRAGAAPIRQAFARQDPRRQLPAAGHISPPLRSHRSTPSQPLSGAADRHDPLGWTPVGGRAVNRWSEVVRLHQPRPAGGALAGAAGRRSEYAHSARQPPTVPAPVRTAPVCIRVAGRRGCGDRG